MIRQRGDAVLFAAEARCKELQDQIAAATSDANAADLLDDARVAAELAIFATPPQTLAGAAVKLRLLAHLDRGVEGTEEEMTAMRQVLALVETSATAAPVTAAAVRQAGGEILKLFQQWRAAYARIDELSEHASDEGFEAAMAELNAIDDRIFETPADDAVSLAVKCFMALRTEYPISNQIPPAMGIPAQDEWDDSHVSLFRDIGRLVPDLQPLCAEFLAAVEAQP